MNRALVIAVLVSGCGVPETQETNAAGARCDLTLGAYAFEPGRLWKTGAPLDLALDGPGYFQLGTGTAARFVRSGRFALAPDGTLITANGLEVQGVGLQPIVFGPAQVAPVATTRVVIEANLDATTTASATPFDPNNPATSADFSSSVTVIDALGYAVTLDIFYKRTVGGWDWHALRENTEVGTGTMTFDFSGSLTASTQAAAPGMGVAFDFGEGTSGITQFGARSSNNRIEQNGFGSGALEHVDVDVDGRVLGSYSNGQVLELGRVAVVLFAAPNALHQLDGHMLFATAASGDAQVAGAGEAGRGRVMTGALEIAPANPDACWP